MVLTLAGVRSRKPSASPTPNFVHFIALHTLRCGRVCDPHLSSQTYIWILGNLLRVLQI